MHSASKLLPLLSWLAALAFGCGREPGKTIYVPVNTPPAENETSLSDSDKPGLVSEAVSTPEGSSEIASSDASLDASGGVIDSSGGSLVYATETQVRSMVAALPDKLYAMFYRIQIIHKFERSTGDEGVDDHGGKQSISHLETILEDLILGNSYQNDAILALLNREELSFYLSDDGCFEGTTPRDGSINTRGEICLDLRRLITLPAEVLEKQLLSLATHEIAHYYGYSEDDAVFLQLTILEARSYIIDQNLELAMLQSFQEPMAMAEQLLDAKTLELSDGFLCHQVIRIPTTMTRLYYQFSAQVFLTAELQNRFQEYEDWTAPIPECVGHSISGFFLPPFARQKLLLQSIVKLLKDLQDLQLHLLHYLQSVAPSHPEFADPGLNLLKNYLGSYFLAGATSGKLVDKLAGTEVQCTLYQPSLREDGVPELQALHSAKLDSGQWRAETHSIVIVANILSTPQDWAGVLLDVDIVLPDPPSGKTQDNPQKWERTERSTFQVEPTRLQSILLEGYNESFYLKIPATGNIAYYFGCEIRKPEPLAIPNKD